MCATKSRRKSRVSILLHLLGESVLWKKVFAFLRYVLE
jgi:hypothetical protein